MRLWATLWIAGRKKQTVVDDGPYRACRNPLYVGSFVMGIGLGLFLKSLAFAAGLGLVMSLYLWFVVPAEERYMGAASALPSTTIAGGFLAGFRDSACCAETRFSSGPPTKGHSSANAEEWPAGCCWRSWPN